MSVYLLAADSSDTSWLDYINIAVVVSLLALTITALTSLYKMTSLEFFTDRMEHLRTVAQALDARKGQETEWDQDIREIFAAYRNTVDFASATARFGWFRMVFFFTLPLVVLCGAMAIMAFLDVSSWVFLMGYLVAVVVLSSVMFGMLKWWEKAGKKKTEYLGDEYDDEFNEFLTPSSTE